MHEIVLKSWKTHVNPTGSERQGSAPPVRLGAEPPRDDANGAAADAKCSGHKTEFLVAPSFPPPSRQNGHICSAFKVNEPKLVPRVRDYKRPQSDAISKLLFRKALKKLPEIRGGQACAYPQVAAQSGIFFRLWD